MSWFLTLFLAHVEVVVGSLVEAEEVVTLGVQFFELQLGKLDGVQNRCGRASVAVNFGFEAGLLVLESLAFGAVAFEALLFNSP